MTGKPDDKGRFRHGLAAVSGIVPLGRRGGLASFRDCRWSRLAAVSAIAVALAVSACGRKGPLDAPPGAAQYATELPRACATQGAANPQIGVDREGKAVAPPPSNRNRSFILDWLVD
jgi:predicted small lipoprotein YifL